MAAVDAARSNGVRFFLGHILPWEGAFVGLELVEVSFFNQGIDGIERERNSNGYPIS